MKMLKSIFIMALAIAILVMALQTARKHSKIQFLYSVSKQFLPCEDSSEGED